MDHCFKSSLTTFTSTDYYDGISRQCLTNEDAIAAGRFTVVVFAQVSGQRPDDNRVDDEDVPHMFVKDKVFQNKPAKHKAESHCLTISLMILHIASLIFWHF